ncbi:MAG: hypothetical protein HYT89_06320 [Candidatus Omnitrophica bacterium]|nr:hypothetical protein [Candidatus Omnitrophota bacterium]
MRHSKGFLIAGVLFGLWLAASAAAAPQKSELKTAEPDRPSGRLFYPPPPEEPRIQFLKSFSSSDDFEKPPSAFKRFIVGEEKTTRPVVKPYGVTVRDGKIYLCDTVRNGIDIFDFQTRRFRYFEPADASQLMDPINLDFDESGNMYVADGRRGQIVIFDPQARVVGTLGESSEFKPTDVLIKNEKIYVCDLKTHGVKVFGLKDRKPLAGIPAEAEAARDEARLFSPVNLAADDEGNIYVSDIGGFRVQKYNARGEYLLSIGSHGDAPGQFARPKGIAVDSQGRIYVVDAAFENVQIFDKNGKLLLFFGGQTQGDEGALVLPAGIALDDTLTGYFSPLVGPGFKVDYLVLVTSQYGDRKLGVFGFGRKE